LAIAIAYEVGDRPGDIRETLHESELLLREDAVAGQGKETAAGAGGDDDRRARVELGEERARPVRAARDEKGGGTAASREVDRRLLCDVAGEKDTIGKTNDRGAPRDRGRCDRERRERTGLGLVARSLGERVEGMRRGIPQALRVLGPLGRRDEGRDIRDE